MSSSPVLCCPFKPYGCATTASNEDELQQHLDAEVKAHLDLVTHALAFNQKAMSLAQTRCRNVEMENSKLKQLLKDQEEQQLQQQQQQQQQQHETQGQRKISIAKPQPQRSSSVADKQKNEDEEEKTNTPTSPTQQKRIIDFEVLPMRLTNTSLLPPQYESPSFNPLPVPICPPDFDGVDTNPLNLLPKPTSAQQERKQLYNTGLFYAPPSSPFAFHSRDMERAVMKYQKEQERKKQWKMESAQLVCQFLMREAKLDRMKVPKEARDTPLDDKDREFLTKWHRKNMDVELAQLHQFKQEYKAARKRQDERIRKRQPARSTREILTGGWW